MVASVVIVFFILLGFWGVLDGGSLLFGGVLEILVFGEGFGLVLIVRVDFVGSGRGYLVVRMMDFIASYCFGHLFLEFVRLGNYPLHIMLFLGVLMQH